ncbi:Pup--protein ligase [Nesterenkonia aerolata]|uniref:Pup--protein ligase n=1 Tax=Nesterenkonia aerolata TaxID=3074079 RepID=A0ABU2DQ41_9MICC|nr:Pup--protein ligase [Nesterenkonia sp. LY-0111]MDR8018627.1 Pup--protein ligase [Nesterenkonia sp. LY-0111]
MERRVFGVETEFGITHRGVAVDGAPRPGLAPDETARYLFRPVVEWGRSSNVFIPNGSRLYLDVGSHPEYATAECSDIEELIAADRAGERIMDDLARRAEEAMAADGIDGTIYLLKNNVDSQGNSYGSHENYLIPRTTHFRRLSTVLLPFLVTRQILCGAGHLVTEQEEAGRELGPHYAFSQRADHMWEGVSSATTRARPIINTRDEPHADASAHRRLHVIVGDSNMSETTQLLRYGTTDLVLRMIESGVPLGDYELQNPIRAIREISHDLTGTATVLTRDGEEMTAVDIQAGLLDRARRFVSEEGAHHGHLEQVLQLWERTLQAVASGDHSNIDTEIDWAIKKRLIDEVAARGSLALDDPRLGQIDMAYHDIRPERGLHHVLVRKGRAATLLGQEQIDQAVLLPPATTRAALRGHFLSTARAFGAGHSVDWVHHKLVDRPLEAIMLKDPFETAAERVETLLDTLGDRRAVVRELSAEERLDQPVPPALSERYLVTGGTVPPPPVI